MLNFGLDFFRFVEDRTPAAPSVTNSMSRSTSGQAEVMELEPPSMHHPTQLMPCCRNPTKPPRMFLRGTCLTAALVDMAARMLAKRLMHRLPASHAAVLQSSALLKSPIFRQAAISPNLVAGTGHGLRKQPAFRYFADSAVARAVDGSLTQTLQEELEYEKEQNKQLAVSDSNSPLGSSLMSSMGLCSKPITPLKGCLWT